jgi:hypothetical protein
VHTKSIFSGLIQGPILRTVLALALLGGSHGISYASACANSANAGLGPDQQIQLALQIAERAHPGFKKAFQICDPSIDLELAEYVNFLQGKPAWKPALTLVEGTFVRAYTTACFEPLNAALRTGRQPEAAQMISHALQKLPPYNGTVYRTVLLPPEVLAEHTPGATVQYLAFTSTTTDSRWLALSATMVMMTIRSRTGKDVSSFSRHPNEKEVLFAPGTRFKILERKDFPGAPTQFVMEEVAPDAPRVD